MTVRSFDEIVKLVADNNRSTRIDNETLVCMIWKESGFDDSIKNNKSSATGLMQVTRDAVTDVNANTAKGTHYDHSGMTDAAANIQCGSYYLDIRIKRVNGDIKKGIERYGTGPGYADNILACGACMKKSAAAFTPAATGAINACLVAIHD